MYFELLKKTISFPKWLYHFILPPAMQESHQLYKQTPLVGDAGNRESYSCVGAGGIWEISVPLS